MILKRNFKYHFLLIIGIFNEIYSEGFNSSKSFTDIILLDSKFTFGFILLKIVI